MSGRGFRGFGLLAVAALAAGLGGCGSFNDAAMGGGRFATLDEKECLTRAMYFESNRGSEEGMLAVGTVVMNRVENPRYPKSICGVVGQPNQFAEGVLAKPMTSRALPKVEKVADALLSGERHEGVGRAMFFHTAGYRFPYRNMHYMVVAGGNAFYDKRQAPTQTQSQVMTAALTRSDDERRITLAAVETAPRPVRPAPVVIARAPAPAPAKAVVMAAAAPAAKAPAKPAGGIVVASLAAAPSKGAAAKAPIPPARSIAEILRRDGDKPGPKTKLTSLQLRTATR